MSTTNPGLEHLLSFSVKMTLKHYSQSFFGKAYGKRLMIVTPKNHFEDHYDGSSRICLAVKAIDWMRDNADYNDYEFKTLTHSINAIGFVFRLPVDSCNDV